MGLCVDRSVRFLRKLGYNVVRHPSAGLEPLHVFGSLNGGLSRIGTLDDLVENAAEQLPGVITGVTAADINGKKTSKLPVSIGLDLLSGIMTGLGGNVGVSAKFEAARRLQFQFSSVTKSLVDLADIGRYLDSGEVRWDATGIREFFEPGGSLFVVTETVASTKFGISAFDSRSAGLELDVDAIQGLLGSGEVTASVESESDNQISFEGAVPLVFGFSCVELAITEHPEDQDELRLTVRPMRAGEVALSLGVAHATAAEPVFFSDSGLIDDIPHEQER